MYKCHHKITIFTIIISECQNGPLRFKQKSPDRYKGSRGDQKGRCSVRWRVAVVTCSKVWF